MVAAVTIDQAAEKRTIDDADGASTLALMQYA
jgi:hypothetical protein